MKYATRWTAIWLAAALVLMGPVGCGQRSTSQNRQEMTFSGSDSAVSEQTAGDSSESRTEESSGQEPAAFSAAEIPAWSGDPSVTVHGGVPRFTEEDIAKAKTSYISLSPLDGSGRCGPAMESVGQESLPTAPRGEIGEVKPTGWHLAKYDWVDGKFLYNRCHLLGYQYSGLNAEPENLITGTRYLNVEGMEPCENRLTDVVRDTGGHVLVRVTPVFEGANPLATGVLFEAQSVEDGGRALRFCVFCYNVEPGVGIDYADGSSWALGDESKIEAKNIANAGESVAVTPLAPQTDGEAAEPSDRNVPPAGTGTGEAEPTRQTYVLNTNTMRFHYPECRSVKDIRDKNRGEFTGDRQTLIDEGYKPCGNCHP